MLRDPKLRYGRHTDLYSQSSSGVDPRILTFDQQKEFSEKITRLQSEQQQALSQANEIDIDAMSARESQIQMLSEQSKIMQRT